MAASLIQKKLNNIDAAFHLKLKAAWVCDDKNKSEASKAARKKALRIIEKTSLEFLDKPTRTLLQIDLLRRTEQFEEAFELIEIALKILNQDDEVIQLIVFQNDLIRKKDAAVHTVDEVA